ncbi:MAG: NAD(P)/FAD-dependent oxidoreductase, partial [Pirellulales bacterium]
PAPGKPNPHATATDAPEPRGDGRAVSARRDGQALRFNARFLVDASGEGGVLARSFGLKQQPECLRTRSRAIFGHFTGVRPWQEWLAAHGGQTEDHPFPCDDAALHHIFEDGWMWVLRFNNGITSAGLVLDLDRHPLPADLSPQQEWEAVIARYPAVAWQFAEAQLVAPQGGLRRTGRVQRCAEQFTGPNWAMLPTTAGIVDALHSSGNAHTLCGIARLVEMLQRHWSQPSLAVAMQRYEQNLRQELSLIDQIVHGCFAAFGRFDLLATFAMTYFAAASVSEQRRRGGLAADDAFLQAHDREFRHMVDQLHTRVLALASLPEAYPGADKSFILEAAQALAPYNIAGLCNSARQNMYLHSEGEPHARGS